jgi:hypothetical protein
MFIAAMAPAEDVLGTLQHAHQRLFARAPVWAEVQRAVLQDALAQKWHQRLQVDGRKVLTQPPVGYKLIGPRLLDRARVLVQDEIKADEPVEVIWNFHTRATIQVQGDCAVLTQGKVSLGARILTPPRAHFVAISAPAPPPQAQQPSVLNLTIRLPERVRQTRISVLLTPLGLSKDVPVLGPLDEWVRAGRINPLEQPANR